MGEFLHGAGRAAQMHQHHCRLMSPHNLGQSRIIAKTAHIVDDLRAGSERPVRDSGLGSVDRNRNPKPFAAEGFNHGDGAVNLLGCLDRLGTGTRGFSADVQQVGAFAFNLKSPGDGGPAVKITASVGKRIRRDVENAHYQGVASQGQGLAGQLQQKGLAVLKRQFGEWNLDPANLSGSRFLVLGQAWRLFRAAHRTRLDNLLRLVLIV